MKSVPLLSDAHLGLDLGRREVEEAAGRLARVRMSQELQPGGIGRVLRTLIDLKVSVCSFGCDSPALLGPEAAF